MSFLISDCTSPISVQTFKSIWILPQKSSDFPLPIQADPTYSLQENTISLLASFWKISNGCFRTEMGTLLRQPKSKVSCQGLCMLELGTGQTACMNFSPTVKYVTFTQWAITLLSWFYISTKLYHRIHCPAQRSHLSLELRLLILIHHHIPSNLLKLNCFPQKFTNGWSQCHLQSCFPRSKCALRYSIFQKYLQEQLSQYKLSKGSLAK